MHRADVAIVGAGIAGLAHALEAARRGLSVVVFERDEQARGASIRNFGMILPVAASPGVDHDRALRSLRTWKEVVAATGVWHDACGVLFVAYRDDEAAVLREFADSDMGREYGSVWLGPEAARLKCPELNKDGLTGALWNQDAMLVDPRETVTGLPQWLRRQFNVTLRFGSPVHTVSLPYIETPSETWRVERAIVCSGADLGSLFADRLQEAPLIKCKLQMMRTVAQPKTWRLGSIVAGGLTLRHYPAFATCAAIRPLKERVAHDQPELDQWGIHVMAAQNGRGELVVGDSHEYGSQPEPFDRVVIDSLIVKHLQGFLRPPTLTLTHRWHGVYVKHASGGALIDKPAPNIRLVTGLGGTGMTTSFGLAQDVFSSW